MISSRELSSGCSSMSLVSSSLAFDIVFLAIPAKILPYSGRAIKWYLNPKWNRRWAGRLGAHPFALVGDVVDDDVVADLVGRGVKHAAGIQPGELIDKPLPVKVRAQHEGVDLDAALGAALHLFESFVNDPAVQHRGAPAAVQAAAEVQRRRGGLAVGNQNDLTVGGLVRTQQLAREAQGFFNIGAVLHEIG